MYKLRDRLTSMTIIDLSEQIPRKYGNFFHKYQYRSNFRFIYFSFRWTHIVVDKVDAKHHESFEVLYVATREGILRKLSVLPGSSTLCLLEELHLVAPNLHQPITALKVLSSQVGHLSSIQYHEGKLKKSFQRII